MSPAFHGKDIEKIVRLNNSMHRSTPIRQVSYTEVDPSKSFIAVKKLYLRPRCERRKQAVAFKLSRLAIRVVVGSYLKGSYAVLFDFGDTHPQQTPTHSTLYCCVPPCQKSLPGNFYKLKV